jgi:iduronate 2-sulfatase
MLNMKKVLILLVLLGSLLAWKPAVKPTEKSSRPNVVFIVCDDLNDYVGAFGGHPQTRTPYMDALAESGIRFLNAQSNIPVCSPSRNSLFTGVYPHDSKDFGWVSKAKQKVLRHNKTFIDLLKENGYYMAGSGKLLHKHEPEPWDAWGASIKHNYGPFVFDGEKTVAHPEVPVPYGDIGPVDGSYGAFESGPSSSGERGEPGWTMGWDQQPFRFKSESDRDLTNDEKHAQFAIQKLREFSEQGLEQPFFLGLGFVRPHTPLHAPQKYFDMFPLDEIELDKWKINDEADTWYARNNDSDKKGLRYYRTLVESYDGDRELAMKSFLQAYLACVAFVDDQIGKVHQALQASPYADNTIVILTSDHGWQMGEKSYLFKNSAWEESCRIPLIISVPGEEPGVVEQPVSLIDVFPTLVDYCQLEGNHKLDKRGADLGGFSLRSLMEDPEQERWAGPDGALSIIGNYAYKGDSTVAGQNFSYRTTAWRYIRYSDQSEELYDHRIDPYEWNNLAENTNYQDILNHMRAEVEALVFRE